MSKKEISRRLAILGGLGLGAAAGVGAFSFLADKKTADPSALSLKWEDLVPMEEREIIQQTLNDLSAMSHGDSLGAFPFEAPEIPYSMVEDYNDERIKLPGYVVPVGFRGEAISEFLLVPFIGACIHVPPPPPNQLVLVQPITPFIMDDTWEPIYATGTFKTSSVSTELADVGYIMWGADVVPLV